MIILLSHYYFTNETPIQHFTVNECLDNIIKAFLFSSEQDIDDEPTSV